MSWIRIWVHLVFSTLNREQLINSPKLRKQVFEHIKSHSEEKGIWVNSVGGHREHVHCLISLGGDQCISKVVQQLKGESSHWITQSKLIPNFKWQDDYWAVSVSESHVEATRKYILEQEIHHGHMPFSKEVEMFMEKYGWKYIQ